MHLLADPEIQSGASLSTHGHERQSFGAQQSNAIRDVPIAPQPTTMTLQLVGLAESCQDAEYTQCTSRQKDCHGDNVEHPDTNKESPGQPCPQSNLLEELFDENIIAKAFRTAQAAIESLPHAFPEIVSQAADSDGAYNLREAEFWTCGFFPGTLHLILERLMRFPQSVKLEYPRLSAETLTAELKSLCEAWSAPLHSMAGRVDTHDLGFIIMPALRLDWELLRNEKSLSSIVKAAHSLASRFVPSAKAIRSWDLLKKKDVEITDKNDNLIVIIDSMCNLDLLYYAAFHSGNAGLADIATQHASTVMQSHLRPEPTLSSDRDAFQGQWYSTCHVANIDPKNGRTKFRMTAQGYANDSTWSRGQAWGILGFAETFEWTKDIRFLDAACGLAEYFMYRLKTMPQTVSRGRRVPLWDFDAPLDDPANPLRDSSAGMIAANGMLVLAQGLQSSERSALSTRYRDAAISIAKDIIGFAVAPERACLQSGADGFACAQECHKGFRFDAVLKFGTANNNANARKRYANHGLVYGDYYFVELGNRLLREGWS